MQGEGSSQHAARELGMEESRVVNHAMPSQQETWVSCDTGTYEADDTAGLFLRGEAEQLWTEPEECEYWVDLSYLSRPGPG